MAERRRSHSNFARALFFAFFLTPFFAQSFTSSSPVVGGVPPELNKNVSRYAPINENQVPEILISRETYLISWNPNTRLLNWAAWKVEMSDFGTSGRSNNFLADVDLQNYLLPLGKQAVVKEDYKGSCYDRGHQVPSADRTSSPEINQLTFLMSNMIPQTAYTNRVVWEHLEHYTRDLVRLQNKKVYIISGPIYDEDYGKIGVNNDIPIPSKNFKIIFVYNTDDDITDPNIKPTVISVVMPNLLKTGKKPYEDRDQLCRESISLSDKPKTPTPTPTPGPVPEPQPPGGGNAVTPVAAALEIVGGTLTTTPTPQGPVDYEDWKKFQTDLKQIERDTGFRIEQ